MGRQYSLKWTTRFQNTVRSTFLLLALAPAPSRHAASPPPPEGGCPPGYMCVLGRTVKSSYRTRGDSCRGCMRYSVGGDCVGINNTKWGAGAEIAIELRRASYTTCE